MTTTLPIEAHCTHLTPLRAESRRRMTIVLVITATVMVVEAVGGALANSLALLADAGHMLADVAAIALALVASHIAQRPATPERSFGLLRIEILAALVNGAALIVIAFGIVREAWLRLRTPAEIDVVLMLGVAAIGLVANVAGAVVLHQGHRHSLNQRGAYLHVLSDLMGSVGALTAGLLILATGWTLADPIVSALIAVLILVSAWRLVRESVDVLLEATPAHISLPQVHNRLADVPGVRSVHDLHVWTVTSGVIAMSGHLVVSDPAEHQRVLEEAQHRMGELGIGHVTVQIERDPTCE